MAAMDASNGTTRVGATLRRRGLSLGLFAAALCLVAAATASAETRVALVIGEGFYRSVPELANPPNDARDVADALKALGFAVTLGVDLDQAHMEKAIGASLGCRIKLPAPSSRAKRSEPYRRCTRC